MSLTGTTIGIAWLYFPFQNCFVVASVSSVSALRTRTISSLYTIGARIGGPVNASPAVVILFVVLYFVIRVLILDTCYVSL